MTDTQTLEIVNLLKTLPAEKIDEVKDFALFLRERYGKTEIIDYSDEWTDKDLKDLSLDTFSRLEQMENEANK